MAFKPAGTRHGRIRWHSEGSVLTHERERSGRSPSPALLAPYRPSRLPDSELRRGFVRLPVMKCSEGGSGLPEPPSRSRSQISNSTCQYLEPPDRSAVFLQLRTSDLRTPYY